LVTVRDAYGIDSSTSDGRYVGPEKAKWDSGKSPREGIVIERSTSTPEPQPVPQTATPVPEVKPLGVVLPPPDPDLENWPVNTVANQEAIRTLEEGGTKRERELKLNRAVRDKLVDGDYQTPDGS